MLRSIVLAACLVFLAGPLRAENRIALVIGNGGYQQLARLPNAVSDAQLIDKSLTSVGFKTILITDGTRQQMVQSMKTFMEAVTPETSVLVYYAGRGIQFGEENYLIPTDSQLSSASDLPLEAFSLRMITEQLERAHPRIAILVLDACRNNPLKRKGAARAGERCQASREAASRKRWMMRHSAEPANSGRISMLAKPGAIAAVRVNAACQVAKADSRPSIKVILVMIDVA